MTVASLRRRLRFAAGLLKFFVARSRARNTPKLEMERRELTSRAIVEHCPMNLSTTLFRWGIQLVMSYRLLRLGSEVHALPPRGGSDILHRTGEDATSPSLGSLCPFRM